MRSEEETLQMVKNLLIKQEATRQKINELRRLKSKIDADIDDLVKQLIKK